MNERIGVVGLGYVGLPVALALARKFEHVVGFDLHAEKVAELRRGVDRNHEQPAEVLKATTLEMTSDPAALRGCTFFVVAVPTPVDRNNVPDLTPVERASETVGRNLSRGAVVVYESTVYPGRHRGRLRPHSRAHERVASAAPTSSWVTPRSESTPAIRSTRSRKSPRW